MIAPWMTYCALIAVLCALSALALEGVCAARRLPARGVWLGAILLSLLLPAAVALGPRTPAAAPHFVDRPAAPAAASPMSPAPPAGAASLPKERVGADALPLPSARAATPAATVPLESVLGWLWMSSSLLLLGGVLVGYARLWRRRGRWSERIVDGVPVLISDGVGPAVVGFLRSRIVLPEWAVQADSTRRRLILDHEQEHIAARDPVLLLLGLLALIAAPWNAALWWQVRRLRLALEIDCDARVLARHPRRAHTYGSLLLEMGRVVTAGPLPLTAFSEPASSLERRIRAMTAPHRSGLRRLVPGLVAAALTMGSIAAIPLPPSLTVAESWIASAPSTMLDAERVVPAREVAESTPDAAGHEAVQAPPADTLHAHFRSAELRELVEREYPPELRQEGVEGWATVRFTIDPEGRARQVEPVIADQPGFGEAALRVVNQLRFSPAVMAGEPVSEQVERFRIHFRLVREPGPERDFMGIDEVLRSALRTHYPELLNGDPARLPYVFFVVDSLGERVLSALDWVPPTIAHEPAAIRARFPELGDRDIGHAGRRSVRLEPDRRPVEVFWAEVDSVDATNVERHGPYPLGALMREYTVPVRVMLSAVQGMHPEVHANGLA
ncbi:MAG TPA: M56 family metallopeptidase, partial [Longimicrobiaceae bacterium]